MHFLEIAIRNQYFRLGAVFELWSKNLTKLNIITIMQQSYLLKMKNMQQIFKANMQRPEDEISNA